MIQPISDRVIIVTGAAQGFGRLVVEKAAALGAKVVGADIDENLLAATLEPLAKRGLEVAPYCVDVTDKGAMDALADFTVERFGRVDVIVNNAGIMPLSFFSDHADAWQAWHKAIDVNVKGVVNGISAVYDHMIRQGRGHVVNLSSTYGNAATEGSGVYSATKFAVNAISESLRVEGQGRIKVSVVRPTGVRGTGLTNSIVNRDAIVGMVGHHGAVAAAKSARAEDEGESSALLNPESIEYFGLDAEHIADNIIYVINQPWGVSVSDITVRASGEDFML